jgi:ribosomal protein S18 acetylase RimI-like enzyme
MWSVLWQPDDAAALRAVQSRPGGLMAQREDGITITEFSMDDYAVVHVLWQRGDLWMRPSDGPDATLLKLTRDPDLFLVARDAEGTVVGTVTGGWDGRRAYVYHLAVAPEHRRRGIADALMDELEERFRRLGALKAKLQILVENAASRAFFARRGYLLETDCEPWGKELVPGGAPPTR